MATVDESIECGYIFHIWSDRYSNSLWAALGHKESEVFQAVYNWLEGEDRDYFSVTQYLKTEGSWLPIVRAESTEACLEALSIKLESLTKEDLATGSNWLKAVELAYFQIANEIFE